MSAIIDHVSVKVADFERAKAFYRETLATLGLELLADFTAGRDKVAGFGMGKPDFWIGSGRDGLSGTHIAFVARSRAEVNAFHAVALSMGGRDNGAPGIRAHYHPNYYGAFVFDPDGNNIEAVFHGTE